MALGTRRQYPPATDTDTTHVVSIGQTSMDIEADDPPPASNQSEQTVEADSDHTIATTSGIH